MIDSLLVVALEETRQIVERLRQSGIVLTDSLEARLLVLTHAEQTLRLASAVPDDVVRVLRLALALRDDAVSHERSGARPSGCFSFATRAHGSTISIVPPAVRVNAR